MKTIAIVILAILTTACAGSVYPGPSDVVVTGNGTEPCAKKECLDHHADTDPRK